MAGKEPEEDRGVRSPVEDGFDADERRPLYRDEAPGGETQILPRTQRTHYLGSRSDFDRLDDDDLDALVDEPSRMGSRTKVALLIAAVAAVAIVGLAIGYAVLNLGDRPAGRSAGNPTAPGTSAGAAASPGPDPAALLTDATMLSARQAGYIGNHRAWKVALTQRGVESDSPVAACLGPDALAGQPASQQTVLRLLRSTGKPPTGILHQADSYPTPEEAARAYALASKALGGCTMAGADLDSGRSVSGLGDQAAAVVVHVTAARKNEYRSVVLSRTGRVVNVVDAAQPSRPAALEGVVKAVASVTQVQCSAAEGSCATAPALQSGPPPLGGDYPGFLAAADLPPVGSKGSAWAGTIPALPGSDFTGSGCETVDWAKAKAAKRSTRTYLLADESTIFGLDEIVLTSASRGAASGLASQVKADLESCATRKLTATVSAPVRVTGVGANGAQVTGWTATVSQQTSAGTARFRVGVVSVGTKTVYSFLNPQTGLDLTDAQWAMVAVRAGQRASQVR